MDTIDQIRILAGMPEFALLMEGLLLAVGISKDEVFEFVQMVVGDEPRL